MTLCVFREMVVQSSFCGDSKHIQMRLLVSFAAASDVGGSQKQCANIFESQKEGFPSEPLTEPEVP